jgi:hypothetical protein
MLQMQFILLSKMKFILMFKIQFIMQIYFRQINLKTIDLRVVVMYIYIQT